MAARDFTGANRHDQPYGSRPGRTRRPPAGDQLLVAVDLVGRAGDCGVGHQVHGERRCRRPDHPPDRQRGAQLGAARSEVGAEQLRGQRVSTKPAAMRLTRMGATSTARLAIRAGIAAVPAAMSDRPGLRLRPPAPSMNSSVPPTRTRPTACCAMATASQM